MIAGLAMIAAAAALDRAGRPGALGQPALNDYDAVFARFLDAVRHVWRNADFVLPAIRKDAADRPPAQRGGPPVHAALLVVGGRPQAVDDVLLRRAQAYALLVNDTIYALPDEDVWKILVHEAVHLGIPGHGADFRRLVIEKGGAVTGAEADRGGAGVIQAQKKIGARFKTIREFPATAEREAMAWARAQADAARAAGTPERWRLQWG